MKNPPPGTSAASLRAWLTWGLGIVMFCGLMTALLVRRELGGDRLSGDALVVDQDLRLVEPIDSWLGFFAGEPAPERRVGHAHLRQSPVERGGREGTRLDLELQLQLQLFGRPTTLELRGESWSPWRGDRREFRFVVISAGSEFELEGVAADGRLEAVVRSAGEEFPLELELPPGALLQPSLGAAMQFPVLEVGESVVIPTFDPITLGPGKARVRSLRQQQAQVGGKSVAVRVYRVETSGFETEAWVDSRGDVVRASTPLGLTLARIDPADLGAAPTGALRDSELLRQTAVFPTGKRVGRGAQRIVARVIRGGADNSSSSPRLRRLELEDERGDPIVFEPEDFEALLLPRDSYQQQRAEPRGSDGSDGSDGEIWTFSAAGDLHRQDPPREDDLLPDAFIQSQHPRITRAAQEILGELGSAASDLERATALYEWVWQNVDKVPVLGVPSALEVLETQRGDCNEHTILFTALARSVSLPTRVAIGLVWSEDLDGFYYHAWPEVWTGEGWIRFDPTLGQERADATHIKLLEGGIERWPRLLAFLGKLDVEILDIE